MARFDAILSVLFVDSKRYGAVGPPIKRDLRIGTEEDVVEYYQDDSANDEAEYRVPLSTRDSIKTPVTPAFPSWTTEQLEEYQTFMRSWTWTLRSRMRICANDLDGHEH
ncbi:hypothetical protein PENARI_c038G03661 [Penicillium arizonense]|uniref:Uncharacterized protein n=1 Tax=Penicillium arizonense TaxID=1835702 RepID=A0A1F5L471_PENAI|nr:hypothetical protein PENARI_c038G03661 [Penicillium arizonense]OGE47711.1 hypothetical protein PENARI_c038G03661 [Penicillium arizonense]